MIFGIIAAGGSGKRLGSTLHKFEVPLGGKPLFYRSLAAFEDSKLVDGVIVAIPEVRLQAWTSDRLISEGFSKVRTIVPGGATRQQSIFFAFKALPAEADIVVIHDGARPLVSGSLIDCVCKIPEGFDGLITAVRLTDTVKEVDDSTVVKTLDRERLMAVQTPQAFIRSRLEEAFRIAIEKGFEGTDDSSLVEFAGGKVGVIKGERYNIKVTYPEDLLVVERLLASGWSS